MKILISLNNNNGEISELSNHFGSCAYYAIYDTINKKLEIIKNPTDHLNKKESFADQILKLNINCIFSLGMGKKAIDLFKQNNITLKTGKYTTLTEVINNIDKLEPITIACKH